MGILPSSDALILSDPRISASRVQVTRGAYSVRTCIKNAMFLVFIADSFPGRANQAALRVAGCGKVPTTGIPT